MINSSVSVVPFAALLRCSSYFAGIGRDWKTQRRV